MTASASVSSGRAGIGKLRSFVVGCGYRYLTMQSMVRYPEWSLSRNRKHSIILGVIRLLGLGLRLGVMAFINARKAESCGVKASAGKVLGVVGFMTGAIVLGVFVFTR